MRVREVGRRRYERPGERNDLGLWQARAPATKRGTQRRDQRVAVEYNAAGRHSDIREVLHAAVQDAEIDHCLGFLCDDRFDWIRQHVG